jgi:hypothetical protein
MALRQSFKFAIFSIYSIHIITRFLQFLDEEFDYEFFQSHMIQLHSLVCLYVPSVMCCFFTK